MTQKIMAINSGSSSLKFQLFEMPTESLIAKGLFERIGLAEKIDFSCTVGSEKLTQQIEGTSHLAAVEFLLDFMITHGLVASLDEISGVGHRVAHGGEYFKTSALLGQSEQAKVRQLSHLAPLHNPVNLVGIEAFQKELPDCPQVGVFDTSYHQTIPAKDYIYPIPYHYYEENQIRRYGFHGTSHQFVAEETARLCGRPLAEMRIIVCHIGNGASICGIKEGRSQMTSMGFTPLAGLMMGTRCGDIDPSIVPFIQNELGATAEEVLKMMNEESGLLGVSGISNDSRDIIAAAEKGDPQAQLALDIYVGRIRQTIGSYLMELGGIDALVFTAGVGENSHEIRGSVCRDLEFLGIAVDENQNHSNAPFIQTAESRIKVLVVPTNEELMIAKNTYNIIKE